MTAQTYNGKNRQRQEQKQIPFGDDNQKDNGKNKQRRKQTTARTTTRTGNGKSSKDRWIGTPMRGIGAAAMVGRGLRC
jgi:hypothetical protein